MVLPLHMCFSYGHSWTDVLNNYLGTKIQIKKKKSAYMTNCALNGKFFLNTSENKW